MLNKRPLRKVPSYKGKTAGKTKVRKGGRQAAMAIMAVNGRCGGEDPGQLLVLVSACHLHNYWYRESTEQQALN